MLCVYRCSVRQSFGCLNAYCRAFTFYGSYFLANSLNLIYSIGLKALIEIIGRQGITTQIGSLPFVLFLLPLV